VSFDLAIDADTVRFLYPEGMRTVVSSNLTLTGTTSSSLLGGAW